MKRRSTIIIAVLAVMFIFALSSQAVAGEKEGMHQTGETVTLSGQISEDGMLVTDDGKHFMLTGDKAMEVQNRTGEQLQITGTVMEADEESGHAAVEVQEYELQE
jgi:hypothetical protein